MLADGANFGVAAASCESTRVRGCEGARVLRQAKAVLQNYLDSDPGMSSEEREGAEAQRRLFFHVVRVRHGLGGHVGREWLGVHARAFECTSPAVHHFGLGPGWGGGSHARRDPSLLRLVSPHPRTVAEVGLRRRPHVLFCRAGDQLCGGRRGPGRWQRAADDGSGSATTRTGRPGAYGGSDGDAVDAGPLVLRPLLTARQLVVDETHR